MGETRQEHIAVAVSDVVGDALDTDAKKLPPLKEAINLDALDSIIPSEPTPDVTVVFRYESLRVHVHSGRAIYVMGEENDGFEPQFADEDSSGA